MHTSNDGNQDLGSIPKRVLNLAVAIQQIPAPTFAEAQRAAFVQQQMLAEGLVDISSDGIGNVYGRLPGDGGGLPLIVSAHLDTVFPQDTPLKINYMGERINGPGIGDNSLGVAGLFGLLWMLRDDRRRGRRQSATGHASQRSDIWFVANVGEEGLGDLCGMKAVVERFGSQVQAYIILEGMALGHIYHRGLGVQRYKITVRTAGGHSWVNYGQPSAIHHLARLVTQLEAITLPRQPRTSLNVGVIAGGTSINTIAAEAHLELDLRSEDAQTLQELAGQVEALAEVVGQSRVNAGVSGSIPTGRLETNEIQCAAEIIGRRPVGSISCDHPLVRLAERCIQEQGLRPTIGIGSTDANIPLSLGLPAVCIGLTFGGNAHTVNEFIQVDPLLLGLAQLLALVQGVQDL